jgi:hypothetical protein
MARRTREIKFKERYVVLGEGITEQHYLEHLKKANAYKYSIKPRLFHDIGIEKVEGIIDDLVSGDCDGVVFLTDYDTIVSQNKQELFNRLVKKYEENDSVLICDSMPSIEYWFLLHFVYTTKEFTMCEEVVAELKKHIKVYSKSAKYLATEAWFSKLMENDGLKNAKENAEKGFKAKERDGGLHFPYTRMHEAIKRFDEQKKIK